MYGRACIPLGPGIASRDLLLSVRMFTGCAVATCAARAVLNLELMKLAICFFIVFCKDKINIDQKLHNLIQQKNGQMLAEVLTVLYNCPTIFSSFLFATLL